MCTPNSNFLRVVKERGFFHQATDIKALDKLIATDGLAGYIGFDATATSLHVGSLVQIMLLRWMQKCDLKPIVLMGGGTSKVGDPSGKDAARQLLTTEDIASNIASIKDIFKNFLTFSDNANGAVLVNNADWLNQLQYIEFLRDYGRHFSVNRMLTFDSVKMRLEREQPLSFLEFNYMVLQSYDFLELSRRYNCRLQLGGSDQWGNIVAGVELGRRVDGVQLFGLTSPLLTTSSGTKMGKTANGAVWLNADMLSPYDYWQYWRNTEDADVGRFMRLFTELPLKEIAEIEKLEGAEINEAKVKLASEATRMCHGIEAASAAEKTARRTFVEGGSGDDLPRIKIDKARLLNGVPLYELMREAGLAKSNGEARRLIRGGGGRLNDTVITKETASAKREDLNAEGVLKLSAGRKRHVLIIPN
jgi:tyrosyl-tRNA synthetase